MSIVLQKKGLTITVLNSDLQQGVLVCLCEQQRHWSTTLQSETTTTTTSANLIQYVGSIQYVGKNRHANICFQHIKIDLQAGPIVVLSGENVSMSKSII